MVQSGRHVIPPKFILQHDIAANNRKNKKPCGPDGGCTVSGENPEKNCGNFFKML